MVRCSKEGPVFVYGGMYTGRCQAVDAIKHKGSANIDPWCGCPVTSSPEECEQKERKKGGPERRDCAGEVGFDFPAVVSSASGSVFRRADAGRVTASNPKKEIATGIDRLLLEKSWGGQTRVPVPAVT